MCARDGSGIRINLPFKKSNKKHNYKKLLKPKNFFLVIKVNYFGCNNDNILLCFEYNYLL